LPISKAKSHGGPEGVGIVIAGALDTLILMNMTTHLDRARDWVKSSLKLSQDTEVDTYAAMSKVLGGLLSANYLSVEHSDLAPTDDDDVGLPGEDLYIEKATDLADRLLGAYESQTKIPYPKIKIASRKGSGKSITVAKAAGASLEFRHLSKELGEKIFWEASEKVSEIAALKTKDGLAPSYMPLDPLRRVESPDVGMNEDTMAYYENLLKQYLQSSREEPVYLDLWNDAIAGLKKYLLSYSKSGHFPVVGSSSVPAEDALASYMSEATCSLPGLLALAATGGRTIGQARQTQYWTPKKEEDMALAYGLIKTCWAMYKATPSGLAPSESSFIIQKSNTDASKDMQWNPTSPDSASILSTDIKARSHFQHNAQNPSTLESLFYLYRITEDETYRNWGWEMFTSYLNHTADPSGAGFVGLADVTSNPPKQADLFNDLWLSRTLKFFYLLFSPSEMLPLDRVVFTASGHVLPRFKLQRGLKTGWSRKGREKSNEDSDEKVKAEK
jgi:endoplasmic reticulum Man9GlcNAc2 1,2-alpha-mannosidase